MAANLNVFKTSKKDCILSKSNFPFAEVHWGNIESDKKIKILTIWAKQSKQNQQCRKRTQEIYIMDADVQWCALLKQETITVVTSYSYYV